MAPKDPNYFREYYLKNKERLTARQHELYEERKEELRELARLRYHIRKEKLQKEEPQEEVEKKPRRRLHPEKPLGRPRLAEGARIQNLKKRSEIV